MPSDSEHEAPYCSVHEAGACPENCEHAYSDELAAASRIDRPHRFKVGDVVAHVDDSSGFAEVVELTWRVRHHVAYPTYALHDPLFDEELDDVLDTVDLVLVEKEQS